MGGGGTHDQRGGEEQSIRAILNTNLMGRINTTGGPTQRRGAIDQGHTSTQTLRGGLIQRGGVLTSRRGAINQDHTVNRTQAVYFYQNSLCVKILANESQWNKSSLLVFLTIILH